MIQTSRRPPHIHGAKGRPNTSIEGWAGSDIPSSRSLISPRPNRRRPRGNLLMMKTLLTAALMAAAPAMAQDASQSPVFGSVTLSAGFDDDPLQRRIRGGGPNNAARLP